MTRVSSPLLRWYLILVVVIGGIASPRALHAQPSEWTTKEWGGNPTCASCHDAGKTNPTPLSHAQTVTFANLKTYNLFKSHVLAGFDNSPTMTSFKSAVASAVTNTADRDSTEQIRLYFLTLLSSPAPTANAGSPQTVPRGRPVSLSGSGGGNYQWVLDSKPATSTATISSAMSATAGLTPYVAGAYEISLVVANAGGVDSAPARVTVTATANAVPTASAGPDQTMVTQGALVTLDGSGSSDVDAGTTLTYQWTVPAGIMLSSDNAPKPTFTANSVGSFTFGLTVSDEVNTSASDSVTVVVSPPVGVLQASPSPLTGFSARAGGAVADVKLLTLANGGPVLSSVALSSFTFSSGYSQDTGHVCTPAGSCCSAGTTLAGGQSCQLWVKFLPPAAGNYASGSVSIGHTASGSATTSTSVTLSGIATQSTIGTTLPGTPPVLAFGSVQNGFSATQTLTVTNTGNATLNFTADPKSSSNVSGSDSAEYSIVGGSCALGSQVGTSSGSCTLDIRFAPTVANAAMANPRQATLTLASDALNGPLVVTLSGNASALAPPGVTPGSLTFGPTAWGDTSASQNVVLSNSRSDDIIYALSSLAGTDFVVVDDGAVGCPGKRITANGGQCTLKIAFRPQTTGAECSGQRCSDLTVTFTPTSGPAMAPAMVHLTGTALVPLRSSASALTLMTMATSSTTGSVIVTNQSAGSVALGIVSFSGATAAYAVDATTTCATTLAAGASCVLAVRYSPSVAGTDEATLTLPFGAGSDLLAVALHGSATAVPKGILQLSALTLAFGDTALTTQARLDLTLRNSGNLALTFSAFELAGANPADFQLAGTCSLTPPLNTDADCVLSVTFMPGALGARAATLTLRSNGVDPAVLVTLAGIGTPAPAPRVAFSPLDAGTGAVLFGNRTMGGSYQPRVVHLTNSGTATLLLSGVAVEGAGFSLVATTCGAQLPPQGVCDLLVQFAPSAADTDYVGALKATTNAAGSPQSAPLRGRGVAYAAPTLTWQSAPSQLSFGTLSVGSVSAVQSLTLNNQGPGGAVLGAMNAVGPAAAEFAVAPAQPGDTSACATGQVLPEGGSCRVDVLFVPAVAGDRSATLQIASNGTGPGTLRLVGIGLSSATPGLALSATVLDLGTVRQGASSAPLDVMLSSSGSGSLSVAGLAVTGPFTVQGRTCPAPPFMLAPGANCVLTVTFVPTVEGAGSGKLMIASNSPSRGGEVELTGQGQAAADVSSGGCSMTSGGGRVDPVLWLLCLIAAAALLCRRVLRRERERHASEGSMR